MYKVVVFDIGGVVHSTKGIMPHNRIAKELNLELELIKFYLNPLLSKFRRGVINENQLWENLSKSLNQPIPINAHELLVKDLKDNIKVYSEIIKFISILRDKGIKVVALTNVNESHAQVVREMGIYEKFDKVFFSYELGVSKPDPELFKKMLLSLDMKSQDCIFIDDKDKNLVAARNLGFNIIKAENSNQIIRDVLNALK